MLDPWQWIKPCHEINLLDLHAVVCTNNQSMSGTKFRANISKHSMKQ